MVPTTLGVAALIFTIYHLAPGDPATVMMGVGTGGNMSQGSDVEAKVDAFRIEHGLDRHPVVQFLDYIGPFNLSRDGHDWFDSPYPERKVEEVSLADGTVATEGKPLHIDYLPTTDEADRSALDEARFALADDAGDSTSWAAATEALVGFGDAAYPALLTTLYDLRLESEVRGPAIDRLSQVLRQATGHEPVVASSRLEELGSAAHIRYWFGWYYTEGGGARVRNTGLKPWGGLLLFELGDEMQAKTAVSEELWKRLQVTVPLSLMAVLLSYLIALPLGIFSVRRQGTKLDGLVTVVLFILYSIPTFWAGLMLILIFGKTGMDLLPVLGLHDKDAETFSTGRYVWDTLLHCILPVATMTYGSLAYLSRQMRGGMLEVIRQDYIRTARAKGVGERSVVYRHALRNALIPVVTILGLQLGGLFSGALLVETVFNWPGLGRLAFESVLRRDYPLLLGLLITTTVIVIVANLLTDLVYRVIDPRIRIGGKR